MQTFWPGQTIRIDIRLRGIDAPEKDAPCATEQARAMAATDALGRLIPEHSTVIITEIGVGEVFRRVLATVRTPSGLACPTNFSGPAWSSPIPAGVRQSLRLTPALGLLWVCLVCLGCWGLLSVSPWG